MKLIAITNICLMLDVADDVEITEEMVKAKIKSFNELLSDSYPDTQPELIEATKALKITIITPEDNSIDEDEFDFMDEVFNKKVKLIGEIINDVVMVEDEDGNQYAQATNKLSKTFK